MTLKSYKRLVVISTCSASPDASNASNKWYESISPATHLKHMIWYITTLSQGMSNILLLTLSGVILEVLKPRIDFNVYFYFNVVRRRQEKQYVCALCNCILYVYYI